MLLLSWCLFWTLTHLINSFSFITLFLISIEMYVWVHIDLKTAIRKANTITIYNWQLYKTFPVSVTSALSCNFFSMQSQPLSLSLLFVVLYNFLTLMGMTWILAAAFSLLLLSLFLSVCPVCQFYWFFTPLNSEHTCTRIKQSYTRRVTKCVLLLVLCFHCCFPHSLFCLLSLCFYFCSLSLSLSVSR